MLAWRHFFIPFISNSCFCIYLVLFCALSVFIMSLKGDHETILLVPALGLSQSHPGALFIPPLRALCGFHHYKSCMVFLNIFPLVAFTYFIIWVGESPLSEGSLAGCFLLQSRAREGKKRKKEGKKKKKGRDGRVRPGATTGRFELIFYFRLSAALT